MAGLLEDMITYLKGEGVVTDYGTDAFGDAFPDAPDNLVSLQEYGGSANVTHKEPILRSVLVRARGLTAAEAKAKAVALHAAVKTENNVLRPNGRFCLVFVRQSPYKIDVDKSNRTVYGFNLGVLTQPD